MTKKRVSFFGMSVALAAFGFFIGVGGCDEIDEEIDESFDCDTVCDRYRDCYDQAYNVDACQDRCEDRADLETFQAAVDACEECIGVNSCASQVFNCPVCATIVP